MRGGAETKVPLVPTAVTPEIIKLVGHALSEVPPGFTVHPRLKIVKDRAAMAAGEKPIDWGMGEALAFGTLLNLGIRVRLSGQDVRRGTFSHRHSVLFDYETGAEYTPLAHIRDKQGVFEVHDSPLSEAGVLGFEYGYSLDMPEGLTIWEAQFGDFVNAAQVIIDQFLCSSEAKWNRVSGLVMLLPHGMEGQGPEHSSARLERFLNMCVNDNMQVCNLTTPAQYFHVLRRQVLRPYRKPLVIMSPKSLLRHPAASSALSDFTDGGFQRIIPDQMNVDPSTVKRVLLCTGKVYYDLLAAREEKHYDDVAIIRIEQLYPMHKDELLDVLSVYPDGTPVVWVQEEARNMGAWAYMNRELPSAAGRHFPVVVREPPAVGEPGDRIDDAPQARAGARDRGRVRQGERVAMSLSLKVPTIGESISEATLGAWKHAEGDYVNVDEPLVEVESEKATFEVPSPGAGILRKILRKAGDTVSVGEVIAEIEPAAREAAAPAPAVAPSAPSPANGNGRPAGAAASAAPAPACAAPATAMRCVRRQPATRSAHRLRRAGCWPRPACRRRRSRGPAAAAASRPRMSCARSRSASTRDAVVETRAPAPAPSGPRRTRRRSPRSTARASAWCRCHRCAGPWPSAWSRRSRPPRSSRPSTRST